MNHACCFMLSMPFTSCSSEGTLCSRQVKHVFRSIDTTASSSSSSPKVKTRVSACSAMQAAPSHRPTVRNERRQQLEERRQRDEWPVFFLLVQRRRGTAAASRSVRRQETPVTLLRTPFFREVQSGPGTKQRKKKTSLKIHRWTCYRMHDSKITNHKSVLSLFQRGHSGTCQIIVDPLLLY